MAERDEGISLSIGDLRQVIPMAFPDPAVEERIRSRLATADDEQLTVRIAPADEADVEGHAFGTTLKSFTVKVQLDDDDVEGHAISVHFPTVEEADQFRRRLIAAGMLTGAVVLGAAGALAVSNLPAAQAIPAPGSATVYERPAGHGFLEGIDPTSAAAGGAAAAAASQTGIDPATGKPARSGFLEGAEPGALGAAAGGSAAAQLKSVQGTEVGAPAGGDPMDGMSIGSPASQLNSVAGTEAGASAATDDSAGAAGGAGPLEGVDR